MSIESDVQSSVILQSSGSNKAQMNHAPDTSCCELWTWSQRSGRNSNSVNAVKEFVDCKSSGVYALYHSVGWRK